MTEQHPPDDDGPEDAECGALFGDGLTCTHEVDHRGQHATAVVVDYVDMDAHRIRQRIGHLTWPR